MIKEIHSTPSAIPEKSTDFKSLKYFKFKYISSRSVGQFWSEDLQNH